MHLSKQIGLDGALRTDRIRISSIGKTMTTTPQHYDEVLPDPGFEITPGTTAVVITDPQVDFLSEDGVVWGIVGLSV